MKKFIFIFLLICMFFVLFLNVDEEVKIISNDSKLPIKDSFRKIENNIVGHIEIDGTNIDSYITQGDDNEFYLNHNYDGEEDINGSIFIDYRNNLTDKKILIYGHNSKDREYALFKDLEKYKEKDFYQKNSYIEININNINYIYHIFSIMIVKEGDYLHTKLNFNDGSYLEHLNHLENNSLYDIGVDVYENDNIIVLQTCNYDLDGKYLLVNARRI